MKEAQFEHRCRRCGVVVSSGVGSETTAHDILVDISVGITPSIIQSPRLLEVHYCDDGGAGIADLIGCRPVPEKK